MTKVLKIVGLVLAGVVVGLLLSAASNGANTGGTFSITEQTFGEGIVTDCIELADSAGTTYTLQAQTSASTTGAAGDRVVASLKTGTCN